MTRMRAWLGDITTLDVDMIVNAANHRLIAGGGVDGAIHRAAGPELQLALNAFDGCPTGSARLTPGFRLPASWIAHAVGPVWQGGEAREAELLAGCYRNALALAEEVHAAAVAFPAISTGVYGYPLAAATRIAVATVRNYQGAVQEAIFCCFDATTLAAYEQLLQD